MHSALGDHGPAYAAYAWCTCRRQEWTRAQALCFPVGLNASAMHCVLVFAASKGLVECILNPSQKLLSQFLDASVKLLEDGEAS